MIRYDFLLNELFPGDFEKAFTVQRIRPRTFGEYIDHYVVLTNSDHSSSSKYLILPDHSGYFIFHVLRNPSSFKLYCIGPRSGHIDIHRKNRFITVIVKFKTGGMFPFVPFSNLSKIADSSCAMHELYPEKTNTFLERILNNQTSNTTTYLAEIEIFLSQCFNPEKIIHKKLQDFLSKPDPFNQYKSVKTLASDLGISERYLLVLTTHQIGLSPKRLLMISRVLNSLKQDTCQNLLIEPAYYDQAHRIDEYHNLLGRTPGMILKEFGEEIS